MKKNLYILIAFVMAVLTFAACSDDDNEAQGTQNPETEVAGVYVGNWDQKLRNSSGELVEENSAYGTVSVTAEKQWVTKITLGVASPVIGTEMTELANCFGNSERGYSMTNVVGTSIPNFTATVKNGVFSIVFKTTVKVGRKTYEATNTFEGTNASNSPAE